MSRISDNQAPSSISALDRYFGIRAVGSSMKVEIVGGITTFLTSMYIIVVNPGILSQAGVPFSAALTATVIVSFLGSCAMGLYARNPVLVAPGMGMNALFAFVMVHGGKMPWQTALGCVFWSGVIFAVLAAFNARKLVVDAIPANLRHAVSCGIGLFISLIGLVNAKFVVGDPVTIVHSASLNPVVITFLIGLAVTTILVARRVTGALMLGIVFTTLIAIPIGRFWGDGTAYWPAAIATKTLVNWNGLFSAPDFSGIGQLDLRRLAEGDLLAVHLRDALHVVLRCALHLHGDLGGRQALRQGRQSAQHPPVDDRRFVLRAGFRAARHEPGERVHRIGGGHFGGRTHGARRGGRGTVLPAVPVPFAAALARAGHRDRARARAGRRVHDGVDHADRMASFRRSDPRLSRDDPDPADLLDHRRHRVRFSRVRRDQGLHRPGQGDQAGDVGGRRAFEALPLAASIPSMSAHTSMGSEWTNTVLRFRFEVARKRRSRMSAVERVERQPLVDLSRPNQTQIRPVSAIRRNASYGIRTAAFSGMAHFEASVSYFQPGLRRSEISSSRDWRLRIEAIISLKTDLRRLFWSLTYGFQDT